RARGVPGGPPRAQREPHPPVLFRGAQRAGDLRGERDEGRVRLGDDHEDPARAPGMHRGPDRGDESLMKITESDSLWLRHLAGERLQPWEEQRLLRFLE